MSTNYLALRNSNLSTFSAVNFTYSSLTGSTITARTATYSTITLASSIVSLGQSTNQTYYGQTNGVYTTGWGSTLNTLTSNVKQVAMGSLGQYQVAVCGASTANSVYVTQNSGQTWSTLSAATGLPTAATTLYTSGAVSATGQYGILATTGGYPYVTSTFGATYANVNPNVPAIYLPFETVPANSSVSQGTSPATLTVVGPPTTVPGFVGTNAIRFANTPGGGSTYATQYIEGSWTASPNFTVSFWFYPLTVNGTQQNIFTSHGTSAGFAITTTNTMQWYASGTNLYNTSFTATANTWYNVTMIYNANSTGYLYINNTLVGTATCPAIPGTSSGYFTIGGKQTTSTPPLGAPNYAFNGYIDDLKIYNSAIAFNPMVPMNYNLTAVSGNGQYMLASVSNGGLFMSSNFGSTWSQVQSVANQGVWTGLCLSHTGQYMLTNGGGGYVIPTLTGLPASGTALTTSPWTVNGVTWIGSASSVHSTLYPITAAFNNYYGSTPPYSWLSGIIYASTSPYQYTGSQSTTILGGVGAVLGEWLTIQSSIPLVMYSYSFACGGFQGLPQTYYIVGSNDNATWYPLQYAVMASNPLNTNFSACTSYLQVNITGTQTLTGTSSANIATTSYSTSTNAYTYFRIIATKLNGFLTGQFELAEWFINFVGGQSYSTNYGNSWVNTTFATGNALAISENGQYAIGANVQTAYIVNNYLAGFSTQSYTSPTLTSINATIVAAAISNTGQYMVLVTAGTSNNLYYSVNYGATFLSITLGSAPLVSCSMSYDGSYITAASATTVYTLNSNGTGFSLAVGANAGAANQAQNAIALGNSAGQTNQTANSIILNASGAALNSYSQGFYVAPIATALSCTSQSVALLGYGTDNQVVQSGITMANSQQVIYGEWVQLQLATGVSITSYVLQPRSSLSPYYPVAWTIVGSLDGVNWTVLDTRSGQIGFASYALQSASPIYTYFRMIVTQINSGSIVDIGGFILYNNGNPILTAPNTTTALAPYTLSGTNNNILSLSGSTVCTVTWSWGQTKNANGIVNDGYSYVSSDLLCAFPFDSTVTDALGKVGAPSILGSVVYNTGLQKVGAGCLDCTINTSGAPTFQLAYNLSLNSSTGFTISFWMNATHAGNGCMICQSTAGATSYGFEIGTNYNNSSTYGIYYGVSGIGNNGTPTNILNYGTWYLISLVLGGNASTLYVNGVSTVTGTTWGGPISYSYFSIAGGHNNQMSYKGYLDDFRIYNRNIIAADALALYNNSYYNPGLIPVVNAYNNTTFNTIAGYTYLGFAAVSTGISYEYNSSYIAIQGTSTIITNPLLQVADLSGNIKFQSSAQYPLDVNGVLRTQQLQFQDGSIQGTASNMQLNWDQFGKVWSQVTGVTPTLSGDGIAISASGQYISTTNNNGTTFSIYVSSNYGQTWSTPISGISASLASISMSSSGQYQSAVANNNTNVYISSNYGQTWSIISVGNGNATSIALSNSGQYQLLCQTTGYVYLSSNYGQTWNISCNSIVANWYGVGISGSGQYQLVAGYGTPVYSSNNYGQTWTNIGLTLNASGTALAVSSSGQYQTISTNTSGIYVSSNYGQSFTNTFTSGYYFRASAMSASGQYQLVALVNTHTSSYYSNNYGQTWSAISPTRYFIGVAISASGQYAVGCGANSGVYMSVVPSYILGNVGIGTSAPAAQLQIYGSSANFTTGLFNVVNTSTTPNTSLSVLAPNMIANNGNCILIGQAASNNNSFQLQYNHVGLGSTNNYMWLVPFGNMNTGGTLYMNAYGNVGIGITNPAYNLDVNGSINCNLFNTSGGITVTYQLNGASITQTTTLRVPGTGVYLLSGMVTLYNGTSWNSSSLWGTTSIRPYLSGFASVTDATGIQLYSSNMVLSINSSGYIVVNFPAGDGLDTFRINYVRIA